MNEQQPKQKDPNKLPWFVHDAADNTIRLVGGLFIFLVALVGVFVLELKRNNAEGVEKAVYLTAELLHMIFAFIAGWIGGSAAAKKPTTTMTNGKEKP